MMESATVEVALMARVATAGAVRMQAMTCRSLAELYTSMARTLDDHADALEAGNVDPAGRGLRLVIESEETDEAASPEVVQHLVRAGGMLGTATGEPLSDGMAEFLDEFDDRIRGAEGFVAAVNAAAERQLPLTCETQDYIAGLVASGEV